MNPTLIQKLNTKINENQIYMKRDDLLPFSFGGNKARKAVLFFEDIDKKDVDTVVTYGAGSSNHCRIIANGAAARGKKCVIISQEEGYTETSNSRLMDLFGAKIIKTPRDKVGETIENTMAALRKTGKPYFVPGGGHGNIGTEAYVGAYKEILEYEKETGIYFDYIFHATGTGTTQAGLVCGQILDCDNKRKIVGISIARKNPYGGDVVEKSVAEYLDCPQEDIKDYVIFDDNYICGGYGQYNDEIANTVKNVMINEGIGLNTTYTGKAFSGMKKYLENSGINGKNILFVNTGGTPLFFDDLKVI